MKGMDLSEFLVKAKINTYASSGEGSEKRLEDGGRELVYEDGNLKYRDIYFGSDYFIGEEVVWLDGKVAWGMNYYGKTLSKFVSSEKIGAFLKEALKLVIKNRPFRGPDELVGGDFKYIDKSAGGIENFEGTEAIFYRGEKVYELKYHGGTVNKK